MSAGFSASTSRWNSASRLVCVLTLCLLIAGCQWLPTRDRPAPPPEPDPPPPAEPEVVEEPPQGDASTAIDLIQAGEWRAARDLLERLREQRPESRLVNRLIRLSDAPVESLLPPPYREIRVAPGETLSEIAGRATGDPLMFIALARLNDLDEPQRLAVGSVLRVPVGAEAPQEAETPEPDPDAVAVEVETVAEFLAVSGQPEQGREMLLGLARSDRLSSEGIDLMIRLAGERAERLRAADRLGQALTVLEETAAALPEDHPGRTELEGRIGGIRVDQRLAEAKAARDRGDLPEAYRLARGAVVLAPDDAEAASLALALRDALVESLHNEALVAWRDRDVDQAIRLWETLVEAVPDFEPAAVYLERARQLRRRLDQP